MNDLALFYVWPDDTVCTDEEIDEVLTYKSDDFVRVRAEEEPSCYNDVFEYPKGADGVYEQRKI